MRALIILSDKTDEQLSHQPSIESSDDSDEALANVARYPRLHTLHRLVLDNVSIPSSYLHHLLFVLSISSSSATRIHSISIMGFSFSPFNPLTVLRYLRDTQVESKSLSIGFYLTNRTHNFNAEMDGICDVIRLWKLNGATFDWSSAESIRFWIMGHGIEHLLTLNLSRHKYLKHLSFALLPGHSCRCSNTSLGHQPCAIQCQWKAAINLLAIAPRDLKQVTFKIIVPEDDVCEPWKDIDYCAKVSHVLDAEGWSRLVEVLSSFTRLQSITIQLRQPHDSVSPEDRQAPLPMDPRVHATFCEMFSAFKSKGRLCFA